MKKLIIIALVVTFFYNFFSNEEVAIQTPKVEEITYKQEENLSCAYVERIYASQQDMWDDNDAAEKGYEAFDRCIEGHLTEAEEAKAWELQRAAAPLIEKKEFKFNAAPTGGTHTLG